VNIRNSRAADLPDLESLYERAFPDEDLLPLVRELLQNPDIAISLVSEIGSRVVGHIMFTKCGIDGAKTEVSLLAPLAVMPDWQGKGIGSDLVRFGLRRLEREDLQLVCVLGDPAFYGRLGFETERSIKPPYPLPEEWTDAWQSIRAGDETRQDTGILSVPEAWRKPELWAP
jgi:putative acetyltransferase